MHFKKNRRGYVCGAYNKHGGKACSDHHVKEDNLVSSILSDIEIILADVKEKNLFTKLEKKMNKEFEKLNI
nr:hypothetical protein [Priestia megaterium]